MKYSEISNLQVQELRKRLVQNRQALFDAKMKHKMQRLSNAMDLRYLKRDIARLETALSVLPESAFVSAQKKEATEPHSGKDAKVAKKKATVKKQKESSKTVKTDKLAASSKTKSTVEKSKKEEVKKTASKEKEDMKKSFSGTQDQQSKPETKKWFGFFGLGKRPSKESKSTRKKTFFRRKSG